jgi:hypothetical protein
VLRTKVDPQATLWESLLPEEFRRLPPGLCAVDAFLDEGLDEPSPEESGHY